VHLLISSRNLLFSRRFIESIFKLLSLYLYEDQMRAIRYYELFFGEGLDTEVDIGQPNQLNTDRGSPPVIPEAHYVDDCVGFHVFWWLVDKVIIGEKPFLSMDLLLKTTLIHE